jgi:hypothetical protein
MTAKRLCIDIETTGPTDQGIVDLLRAELLEEDPPSAVTRGSGTELALQRAGYLDHYRGMKGGKVEWLAEQFNRGLIEARLRVAIDKAAVDTLLAQPVLACYAADDDDDPVVVGPLTEPANLVSLRDLLDAQCDSRTCWVGHNILGFDIPLLITAWRRAGIMPPMNWPKWRHGRVQGQVWDTMKECGTNRPFTSAQKAACAHGMAGFKTLRTPDGRVMDGSLVPEMWIAGHRQLIADYCVADVQATRKLAAVQSFNWTALNDGYEGRPLGALDGEIIMLACEDLDRPDYLRRLAVLLKQAGVIGAEAFAAMTAEPAEIEA